jgi:hypothetical protein
MVYLNAINSYNNTICVRVVKKNMFGTFFMKNDGSDSWWKLPKGTHGLPKNVLFYLDTEQLPELISREFCDLKDSQEFKGD